MNFELLEQRRMLDASAELVRNLNSSLAFDHQHAWLDDELFFLAADRSGDIELWGSDGTESGTVRVKDIRLGRQGSLPNNLVATTTHVYFTSYDESHGRALWRSDGTEQGTQRVAEIFGVMPGDALASAVPVAALGDRIYLSRGGTLWVSDGTELGTRLIMDTAGRVFSHSFVKLSDKLYFVADDGQQRGIWESDGTVNGTKLVANINAESLAAANGKLFFTGQSDGRRRLLSQLDPNSGQVTVAHSTNSFIEMIPAENQIYFSVNRREIWRTDGTEAGKVLLKSQSHSNLTPVGDELFFTVRSWRGELWRSDGTVSGTRMQLAGNTLSHLREANGDLYFSLGDRNHGEALHRLSNGELTKLDAGTGEFGASPSVISGRNGLTYFWTANEAALWVTGGTQTTTKEINGDISGRSRSSSPSEIKAVEGGLMFFAWGPGGNQLWRGDGTGQGLAKFDSNLRYRNYTPDQIPDDLPVLGGNAYFVASDPDRSIDNGLWRANANVETPVQIKPAEIETLHDVGDFKVVGSRIYFSAFSEEYGQELWSSDGTSAGTLLVRDINVGIEGSEPQTLVDWNGSLLFLTSDGDVWKSDGTTDGTQLVVSNQLLGSLDARGARLHPANDRFYITGNTGIWVSDGSSEGTRQVFEERPTYNTPVPTNGTQVINGKIVFAWNDPEKGNELWVSDGTDEGTRILKDIAPGEAGSRPMLLSPLNDALIFGADSDLWKTDGTTQGTVRIHDVWSSDYSGGRQIDGHLYFGGYSDNSNGPELWRTDGTEEGTVLLTDISTGARSSIPKYATKVNGYLFFSADDGFHGEELWRLPIDPLPGDTDGNGTVDFDDFLKLAANFGREDIDVRFTEGDVNEDGKIDFDDFLLLAKNFGKTYTAESDPGVFDATVLAALSGDDDGLRVEW